MGVHFFLQRAARGSSTTHTTEFLACHLAFPHLAALASCKGGAPHPKKPCCHKQLGFCKSHTACKEAQSGLHCSEFTCRQLDFCLPFAGSLSPRERKEKQQASLLVRKLGHHHFSCSLVALKGPPMGRNRGSQSGPYLGGGENLKVETSPPCTHVIMGLIPHDRLLGCRSLCAHGQPVCKASYIIFHPEG